MTRMDMRKHHKLGMAAVLGLEGYSRTHLPKGLYELVKLRAPGLLFHAPHGTYLYVAEQEGGRITGIQVHANPAKLAAARPAD